MGRTKILVPESNHELLKKNFWENFLSPESLVVVGGGRKVELKFKAQSQILNCTCLQGMAFVTNHLRLIMFHVYCENCKFFTVFLSIFPGREVIFSKLSDKYP